jgi:hypothetical protein
MREYTDREGVRWTVWSVVPGEHLRVLNASPLPAGLRTGWLCFQSPTEKRRLCPLPAGWEDRSDSELDILRRAADLVKTSVAA